MTGFDSSGCTTWITPHNYYGCRHELLWDKIEVSFKTEPMTPFEIKVTIPISKNDIFENNAGCSRQEVGMVSVEKAKAIRDAINRQLAGLKATAPKKKTRPANKKTATKKRK